MESDSPGKIQISTVVSSNEFEILWREANRRYISKSELEDMPMPMGVTSVEMHQVIETLLCYAGVELPFKPYVVLDDPKRVWISLTREIRDRVESIDKVASATSDVGARLLGTDPFLQIPLVMDELITVCALDGFVISKKRANAVWFGGRVSETVEERVFLYLCEMFLGTSQYSNRKITRGFVESIHEHFIEEVGVVCDDRRSTYSSARLLGDEFTNTNYYDENTILETIIKIINEKSIPPVISGLQSLLFMLNLRPFQEFNHMTSLILHKVFYENAKLPLLAHIPLVGALQAWREGVYGKGLRDWNELLDEGDSTEGLGLDATPYTSEALALIERELSCFQTTFANQNKRLTSAEKRVRANVNLNIRQKDILSSLMRHPLETLLIEDVKDSHAVSYSTARQDLLRLVDFRYLNMKKDENAISPFVFSIGQKLLLIAYAQDAQGKG